VSFRRRRNLELVAPLPRLRRDPSCKFLGMTPSCFAVAVVTGKTVR
jgi:hypothetical protein